MLREQDIRRWRKRGRQLALTLAAVPAVLLAPAVAHGAYNLGEMHPQVNGKAMITGDSARSASLTFVNRNEYNAYFCIKEYSGSNPSVKLKYHLTNGTYVTRSWGTGTTTFLCHWAFRGDDPRTRERESDPNPLPTIRSITVYLTAGGETETRNYPNPTLAPPPTAPPDGHPPSEPEPPPETEPESDDVPAPAAVLRPVRRVVLGGPNPTRRNAGCLRVDGSKRIFVRFAGRRRGVTEVVFTATQTRTDGDVVLGTRSARADVTDTDGPFLQAGLRPRNGFFASIPVTVKAEVTWRLEGPFAPEDDVDTTRTKRYRVTLPTCS